MSEMRMCSDISSTGIISPVIGDFMYLFVHGFGSIFCSFCFLYFFQWF